MEGVLFKKQFLISFGRGVAIVSAFFFGGFILYFRKSRRALAEEEQCRLANSSQNKSQTDTTLSEIPPEKMERLVRKVKNKIIILLANLYDKTVLMKIAQESKAKSEEKKEEKDIVVETISSGEFAKPDDTMDQKSLNTTIKKPQKQTNNMKQFFNTKQIYDQIIKSELNIVNEMGYNSDQYIRSLKFYCITKNEAILHHVNFLSQFKKSIENDKLYDFDFGDDIRKNYLKIVTNIYYLNIRRVQQSFRREYIDRKFCFKDNNHLNEIMNDLYSRHLKESRSEVAKFFDLKENKHLDLKIILRLFYYYLHPFNNERLKMDEVNQEVNEVLANLSLGHEYPVLLNDDHPHSMTKPRDAVVDFKQVLKEKKVIENLYYENESIGDSLENSLNNDTNASKAERGLERLKEILRRTDEKYKGEN